MRPASASVEDPYLDTAMTQARQAIRRQARTARRQVNVVAAQQAASAVAIALQLLPEWPALQRIGAYAAVASELSLQETIQALLERGREVYLPHVEHSHPSMRFARWRGDNKVLRPNRFGIPEPVVLVEELLLAEQLDAILMPLLAFDPHGQRLGSGAGYYDRALAHRLQSPPPPLLIGVAYACQQASAIPAAPWDVALDLVLTENGCVRMPARIPV